MLKIAVAGCGRLARQVHLPVLARLPDVETVAVVDPDVSSQNLAVQICPRARAFSRLTDIWNAVEVDAVLVSAPTFAHADLAVEALTHGKHLYLEKPLAADMTDAERILAAWRQTGQVAMVGFNSRFHRLFESARRMIQEGTVGTPLLVSTVFASSHMSGNSWRSDRGGGGGALLDLASHHVDLIHFLFGESVISAFAQTSSTHAEQGSATLQLKLKSGLLVSSAFSFGTVDRERLEIFGDRALLRVNRYLSTECEVTPAIAQRARLRQLAAAVSFLRRPGEILAKRSAPGNDLSYGIAMRRFVDAARDGAPCAPDLNDGYRALAVLTAAERSAASHSWAAVA